MRRAVSLIVLLVPCAALAQPPALVVPPGAREARRSRHDRSALVDCAEHGVWRPPAGWSTRTIEGATFAIAPGGSAALVRARARPRLRDDATFLAQVSAHAARFAGATPELGAVTGTDVSRWRRERSVEGTVSAGGVLYRVLGRSTRTEALWVALYRDERPAIDAAIGSWLMLTSHACECGDDCDHRR